MSISLVVTLFRQLTTAKAICDESAAAKTIRL